MPTNPGPLRICLTLPFTAFVPVPSETDRVRVPVGAALFVWMVAVVALGAALVLRHKVPLPETELRRETVGARIASTRRDDEVGKWLVVHILYGDCGCSAKVFDTLLHHPADRGAVERIALVTGGEETPPELVSRATSLGYRVVTLSRDALVAGYGIQAAPSMAILGPANELRYLGGYSRRKRGPVLEDRDVIKRALAGETIPPLPTFGCAVGRRLEARVNPLRI
jgi:hypothetical protein